MDKKYKEEIRAFFKDCTNRQMTKLEFESKKVEFSKKYKLKRIILTSDVFLALGIEKPPEHLITKPNRTLSGVTVVAVMTKPSPCPGNCVYCPNWDNAPKSYTGFEPASMRAKRNSFDPRLQIRDRLKQLKNTGHPINKIELIVMGGTFPAMPVAYQEEFMRGVYQEITNSKETNIETLKKKAMKSRNRIVGITFETRPDYCGMDVIKRLLYYGGTRVELGVQILDDTVLKKINRGHGTKEVIKATQELKDSGFKVLYHMMLNLPNSNYQKDLLSFKEVFTNQAYKPDMLKIYPCLVVAGTELEKMYYSKEYTTYGLKKTINLIASIKEITPSWVRIMRVQRDIPSNKIIAGIKKSNLRQLVEEELKRRGKSCNCIRCSEPRSQLTDIKGYEVTTKKYNAQNGTEYFIKATKGKYLLGFVRLRLPYKPFMEQITRNTSIVRELHVYGKTSGFDERNIQHSGIGKRLLKTAEDISMKEGYRRVAVISGVGVREYYKKQGYKLIEPYMIKEVLKK